MNRMRLKIASRLKEAQNTNAMLTTFNELDMSNIMQVQTTHHVLLFGSNELFSCGKRIKMLL